MGCGVRRDGIARVSRCGGRVGGEGGGEGWHGFVCLGDKINSESSFAEGLRRAIHSARTLVVARFFRVGARKLGGKFKV